MADPVTSRVHRIGNATMLTVPKKLFDAMGWRTTDFIALRWTGRVLIAERIPVERLAVVGIGEDKT